MVQRQPFCQKLFMFMLCAPCTWDDKDDIGNNFKNINNRITELQCFVSCMQALVWFTNTHLFLEVQVHVNWGTRLAHPHII